MAINPKLVVTSDLEGLFRDKSSGLPLANGYILFFSDVSRNVPKDVYQLNNAPIYDYANLGSKITLSAAGTPQNGNGDNIVIYYWPYVGTPTADSSEPELYFVEVYDENNNLMFTREAWPNPSVGGSTPPSSSTNTQQNQISNPTFTNVFINSGANVFSFTAAVLEEVPIAPDWSLAVSGTGSVTVTREAIAGASQIPTSPPYDLLFTVGAGITVCRLKQKFKENSGLWTTTSAYPLFLTGSFVAQHTTPDLVTLTMFAAPNGLSPVQIVSASVDSNFKFFGGTSPQIAFSTNASTGDAGFVDIYLELPLTTSIRLSSVNLFPSSVSPSSVLPSFDATNRNLDFQSNYYVPELIFKYTPSILTGWDFSLNPKQFGSSGNLALSSGYIVDQTIAAYAGAGSVSWVGSSSLNFTTVGANNAFYILQYLSESDVYKVLNSPLSVNIFAHAITDDVVARVYLFRGISSSAFPISATGASIGTIAPNGVFTPTQADWFPFDRNKLGVPFATLNEVTIFPTTNLDIDIGFSGWSVKDTTTIAQTNKFAMVVTFQCPTATTVSVHSVSLTQGDLPCRPASQSADEVLRQCQYYYEKSYAPSVVPGAISLIGSIITSYAVVKSSPDDVFYYKNFTLQYKTVKRTVPGVVFYSPNNTAPNLIRMSVFLASTEVFGVNSVTTNWLKTNQNIYTLQMVSNLSGAAAAGTTNDANQGIMTYHYVVDARLGVVP